MAFWKIATAAIAAIFLASTSVRADECVTIDKFHYTLSSKGIALFGSRAAATIKMEAVINKNRATVGKPALKAAILLVGYVKDANNEVYVLAAVVGEDGCVIQETVATLKADTWISFLTSAGVEVEDFFPIEGA